ncbi:MAG: hypothetical protein GQ565_03035 [Candidatus Aegiribacteria sp.]|nr:hypothetical protein [Candidatus Aegiribacteria sp.]
MIAFLDMDGVLANWVGGIHKLLNIPFSVDKWPYKTGREGWHFHNEIGLSFEQIDGVCDYDLWTNLDWTPDGRDIYSYTCLVFGRHNIRLLTAPMPNVMSASGKVAWVQKNIPELSKQLIISTAPKSMFARVPDSVLIDDSSDNVDAWRAAGGRAILVPRPWNDDCARADRASGVVFSRMLYNKKGGDQ